MRILITGGNGQLGHDCQKVLGATHTLYSMDLPELDIAAEPLVQRALAALRPEAIINCAAYTRVDAAEQDAETARRANALGPALLARQAAANGIFLLHISTDYVFDGRRPPSAPYLETDAPAPMSVYGRTKWEGEQAILGSPARAAILRTAWLYGARGANFPKAILKKALRFPGQPLRVINDQYGSPTWSFRLAQQVARVLQTGATGLFHATAEGHTTWYEFARFFLQCMQVEHPVEPCTTADYPLPAPRPANSILENAALKAYGLNVMTDWQADVRAFAAEFHEQLMTEARA